MKNFNKDELADRRHALGIYSIKELSDMFGMGRSHIDYALNTNQLKYVSPNNRTRFILLKDFIAFLGMDFEDLKKDSNFNQLLSGRVEHKQISTQPSANE